MTAEEKVDAFMPLWIGAYLADTLTFTTLQHGAYFLLLMAYWRERAPLADDDEALRSIAKADKTEWKKLRPVLARKFRIADGVWWHKRVEQELADALKRKAAAVSKAKKAAEARWVKEGKQCSDDAPSMLGAMPEDVPEECPTTTPSSLRSDSVPDGTAGADASARPDKSEKPAADPEKQRLWREGKALLMADGLSKAAAGEFIGSLAQRYPDATHPGLVRDAIDSTLKATPPEPKAYLVATCQRLAGERNTVPSDAAERTAAAARADEARHAAENPQAIAAGIAAARAAAGLKRRTDQPTEGERVDP